MTIDQKKLDNAIKLAVAKLQSHYRGRKVLAAYKRLMREGGNGLDIESGTAFSVLVIATVKEHKFAWLDDIEDEPLPIPAPDNDHHRKEAKETRSC